MAERTPRLAVTVSPGYESVAHVHELVGHMLDQGFQIVTTDRKRDAAVLEGVRLANEHKTLYEGSPRLPLIVSERARGATALRCQSKDLLGSADQALFFLAHWPADAEADRPHPIIREWPEGAWMMAYQLETLEHPYAAIDETGDPMTWIGEDSVFAYRVMKARTPGFSGKRPEGVEPKHSDDGNLGRQEKPGRNAPCYCGSGRKYKRCHLPIEDEAAEVFRTLEAMSGEERAALLAEVQGPVVHTDDAGYAIPHAIEAHERPLIYGPDGRPLNA